uniref:Uncharacterized protein n=1 Tax=Stomoxys calcitrans TaxID=35570 RepID=A0A2Y9D4S7_STOCA
MKLVNIVLYFLIMLFSGAKCQTIDDYAYIWDHCIQQFPLSDDELSILFSDPYIPSKLNNNIKCFGKCTLEQRGWFIDDVLVEDVFVRFQTGSDLMSKQVDKVHEFVKECKHIVGANKCDTVHLIVNCLENKIHNFVATLYES